MPARFRQKVCGSPGRVSMGSTPGFPASPTIIRTATGSRTLMEWKHGTRPTDRLSRPHRQTLSL